MFGWPLNFLFGVCSDVITPGIPTNSFIFRELGRVNAPGRINEGRHYVRKFVDKVMSLFLRVSQGPNTRDMLFVYIFHRANLLCFGTSDRPN